MALGSAALFRRGPFGPGRSDGVWAVRQWAALGPRVGSPTTLALARRQGGAGADVYVVFFIRFINGRLASASTPRIVRIYPEIFPPSAASTPSNSRFHPELQPLLPRTSRASSASTPRIGRFHPELARLLRLIEGSRSLADWATAT